MWAELPCALACAVAPSSTCSASVARLSVVGDESAWDASACRHTMFFPRADLATLSPGFEPYVLLSLTNNRGLVRSVPACARCRMMIASSSHLAA